MLFSIAAPANNERGPRYMERALAAIHQALHPGLAFQLEYGTRDELVGLFVRVPDAIGGKVIEPIRANYPSCSIVTIDDEKQSPDLAAWSAQVILIPELFPILRHAQFEDMLNGNLADPISGILRAIRPNSDLRCSLEIHATPVTHTESHRASRAVRLLDRQFFRSHHRFASYFSKNVMKGRGRPLALFLGLLARQTSAPTHSSLETSASRLHDREEDLQAAAEKIGGHLFAASIRITVRAPSDRHRDALDRIQQIAGSLGAFSKSRLALFHISDLRRDDGAPYPRKSFLLAHEEIATLWHPPTSTVAAERMQTSEFTELEAPAFIYSGKEEGAVVLGRARFRDDDRSIGLAPEDRRRHVYIVGKTGMGKTTLIQNQILGELQAGRGLCVVDPHGDLAESIIGLMPSHRTNDVIVFDAGDRNSAISFNPLACPDPSRIDQVTSGVVSAFKKLHDSWGPRLEDTLRNAVFATVEHGGTMMSLMRLLGEKTYREQLTRTIRDEVVRAFWQHEFSHWSDNYRTEAVAAIQNKIRPFLTNTNIRAIVSQPGRSLDLRRVMDAGKVLIVNLSKGRVGEDNATLLGAFLVTSIQQAAMTRAEIPEEDRRDFYLYVDEFQNFTTGSFASVLSEARKYRLSLTVAHQYLSQLNDETANAVWGNVGSMIAFQVGSDDAEVLAQQLSKYPGQIILQDLTSLPRYTAYCRLLVDGMPSNPFSIKTPPPLLMDKDRHAVIYHHSRRQYSRQHSA